MTSTIFWSLSGDLIILQIRLKQKKKGELWHPCFIYLNFDEIISNTLLYILYYDDYYFFTHFWIFDVLV